MAPLLAVVRGGVAAGRLRRGSSRDLGMSFWTLTHGFATLVLMRRIRVRSPKAAAEYYATVLAPLLDGMAP